MKISIVTINYNNSQGLMKTIESYIELKRISAASLEYIVIDGDSKDDSKVVLYTFSDYCDVLISEHDYGIYDAMNKALQYITGDFVIFMNSGDRFIPDGFCKMASHATDIDYAHAGKSFVDNSSKHERQLIPAILRLPNHQATLFPAAKIKERKFLWDKYPINADLDHKALFWFSNRMKVYDIFVAQCGQPGVSLRYERLWDVFNRALSRYKIALEHAGISIALLSFTTTMMRQSFRLVTNKLKR